MSVTWKLALTYAWRHPARMILTSLAMVASAGIVVWVVSGYDALLSQFGDQATEYLGRYDLFLVPDSPDDSFIPAELIAAIGTDPAVAEMEPVLQAAVTVLPVRTDEMAGGGPPGFGGPGMIGPGGPGGGGPGRPGPGNRRPGGTSLSPGEGRGGRGRPSGTGGSGPPRGRRGMFFGSPKLVGTRAETPPYELIEGRWIEQNDPALREAVVSNQAAERLSAKLGDELTVIFGTKEYRLTVIGIVAQTAAAPTVQRESPTGRPMMSGPGATLGPAHLAVYVPMPLAERIAQQSDRTNLVSIKLRESSAADGFRARWLPAVSRTNPPVLLAGVDDIAGAMESGFMASRAKGQAWAATGISLLAALFIIFTTLSMGVSERVRQFAVLRAVGLTRFQVARIIGAESLLLGLIGWCGGLAAGWGLLRILSSAKPDLFAGGVSLGHWCVALTGLSAFGGALAAAILPAWQATRVRPLDAMSPRRSPRPSMRASIAAGMAGLALIAVNPLLVYATPIADAARYGVYMAVGCTSMAVGFLLLAPMAIAAAEGMFAPWIARLGGVEPRLLRSQLSSNLWRTVGATVALTVGLGLYVSMMVWGYSMLEPFKPGDWMPDMLVAFQMGGLPDAEIDAVRRVEGVVAGQCIPLAVEQPRLADDVTDSRRGSSVTRQDNVIMVGLDPQVAFGGDTPLMTPEFVAGSREEAISKLQRVGDRYCIVPDHFLSVTGLKVGDRFGVIPPDNPEQRVEYTIAGAVSLPGWHWMTKFSGLRRRSGRSAAMVFAAFDDVRRDFEIRQTNFFWMNTNPGGGAEQIGAAMQPIADRNLGEAQPVNAQGTWEFGATMFGQSLRITTPDGVRSRIIGRADDMIWAMCQLPLITLLVSSLAVVNTIMASVRARRWEMGVLRAMGVTRWTLARMIVLEGLLIGLVACLLSLGFGVMAGWCGAGISQYVSFFGGLHPALVVPWSKLALGFGATLLLCLVAAAWPALATGRAEPLRLLQAGRAAM
ncbi:MAG: ABC transporter permease [Thermoguttaceae bacterium]|jgi:putative ABC transport system permease protein|nr:ABC transporter permease [Thermoguttaceae bacterium]